MAKYLLIEPQFPIPSKSKNHKNFLPIGLLKIATLLREKNHSVKLVRGNIDKEMISCIGEDNWNIPNEIYITSLFTYWSEYVRDSVIHYRTLFPSAKITVGGIYASLMPNQCKKYTKCDTVFRGIWQDAEKCRPDYKIIHQNKSKIDYQIIHASRGCIRKCHFCGTWKIENKYIPKETILREIIKKKIVFYDNNLLANPNIYQILDELIELKKKKKIKWCESQSGFDGRILLKNPDLARKIKLAGFKCPRIAWDWEFSKYNTIKKQIDILIKAGYSRKDIYIFMIYNWNISYSEMEQKRIKCWNWRVQISDCRYRPLNQIFDHYMPRTKNQSNKDYYIHQESGWTDQLVKQFRKNVRRQNICVRHDFKFHSKILERKGISKRKYRRIAQLPKERINILLPDVWYPNKKTKPS